MEKIRFVKRLEYNDYTIFIDDSFKGHISLDDDIKVQELFEDITEKNYIIEGVK